VEDASALVDAPEHANLTPQTKADCAEYLGQSRFQIRGSGQDAADGNLQAQPLLGFASLRHVEERDHTAGGNAAAYDGKGRIFSREERAVLPPKHLVIKLDCPPTPKALNQGAVFLGEG
jgi:hypothetical protein